ncbi:hypothetical protein CCR75_002360 [Bremia lactucae]|uniref:Uncharacterized protein n=1 Tax=Bremia lactucae TaxID=4779 RepID=A0A976FMZ1_BRELC|nr:hypothetical protein CCR75_002360 [Bremia lactucae]
MSSFLSLLLLAAMFLIPVAGQFSPFALGGNNQSMSSLGTQSSDSQTTSLLNNDGSLQDLTSSSMLFDFGGESGSEDPLSDEEEPPSSIRDESDSWSSGSSSSSFEYGCDCRSVRRVSLMGASDYCLDPNALLSSKCGNIELEENGACPITGAQPCSLKGHVLTNDSVCALDRKDETFKCVASENDLEIQKNGKKRKNRNRRQERDSSSASRFPHQWLGLAMCVGGGVFAGL